MFIAEIGINHNGDLNIAKQLIDMAKASGADVVKFQKRDLDICIPKAIEGQLRDTPWGRMTYRAYKERLEFDKEAYDEINEYCKSIGIKWTASVWDTTSLAFIDQYDVPFIKIPSACITEVELLEACALTGKPIIISVGMSTEDEVDAAVKILNNCELSILHCNSSYPSKDNELDLLIIDELKKKYPSCVIGYSGHEIGIMPTFLASVVGAEIIERHITLDKAMWGTDQKASIDGNELVQLIQYLEHIPEWLGSNKIQVYDSEKEVMKKLRKKVG